MPQGKQYGKDHGRSNAFGLMIGTVTIDFIDFGDIGVDLVAMSIADGNSLPAGESKSMEVSAKRYPGKDRAQDAFLQAWLLSCKEAGVDAVRSGTLFTRGPGDTIASSIFIGTIWPRAWKEAGKNRESAAPLSETWTFVVNDNQKTI